MAANPPGQGFQNKNRVAILAELDKEKRRLIQSQSMNNPGASIPLSRPAVKEFRDQAEQQHIAAQQKAALQHAHAHSSGFFITQDSSFDLFPVRDLPPLPKSDGPVKVLLAEEVLEQQVEESHAVLPGLLQHGRQFVVRQVESAPRKQLLLSQPGRTGQRHLRPLVKDQDSINDRLQVL
uniref:SOSS complex subunit C n=1 Tax=Cyprinus carpio carpio TaxID=630221 RepID=A0A9J8A6T3_CYPCA